MTTRKTILVVEDEEAIRLALCDRLEGEGFDVISAEDGAKAVESFFSLQPDLVLLDILLPDKSGYEVLSAIRAEGSLTPILMLTAKDQEQDKVHGLDLGADDYITKPFGTDELLARIRANLRRTSLSDTDKQKAHDQTAIQIGTARVDIPACRIHRNDEEFPLSPMELKMLEMLIQKRGHVVSREDFLNRIWGFETSNTRTVDFHIFRLRRKLEEDPNRPGYLKTIHGIGYLLEKQDA